MIENSCDDCYMGVDEPGLICKGCGFVFNNKFKTWPIPWQELWEDEDFPNATRAELLTAAAERDLSGRRHGSINGE